MKYLKLFEQEDWWTSADPFGEEVGDGTVYVDREPEAFNLIYGITFSRYNVYVKIKENEYLYLGILDVYIDFPEEFHYNNSPKIVRKNDNDLKFIDLKYGQFIQKHTRADYFNYLENQFNTKIIF